MESRHYWGYRIYKHKNTFIFNELKNHEKLRQGWGYLPEQDLRVLTVDEGARRNLSMFNKVKKNDILLVPKLPTWDYVAIVEATKDWNEGYEFDIPEEHGDLGHIFPAKYIKCFSRTNKHVTKIIRGTLKNRLRFWNIDHCGEDIENLLKLEQHELETTQSYEERFVTSISTVFNEIFDEKLFTDKLYGELTKQFGREEWEKALVKGLSRIFPSYKIDVVGGGKEKFHGTDILIRIPGIISEYEYCIAIQVKDYNGLVPEEVIAQINKADNYWNLDRNLKLIEKIVIVIRADKDDNKLLVDNESGVRFIFSTELKELLTDIGKAFIGEILNKNEE